MGGAAPPQRRYFLDFLQRFNCAPIQIITSGGLPPPTPATCFFFLFFFFFTGIDMPSYLNHHFFDPVNPPAAFLILLPTICW